MFKFVYTYVRASVTTYPANSCLNVGQLHKSFSRFASLPIYRAFHQLSTGSDLWYAEERDDYGRHNERVHPEYHAHDHDGAIGLSIHTAMATTIRKLDDDVDALCSTRLSASWLVWKRNEKAHVENCDLKRAEIYPDSGRTQIYPDSGGT